MAVERLTSDAYELIIKDFPGVRDPWGVGWDMSHLFGGDMHTQHRLRAAGLLPERPRRMHCNMERSYRSLSYPVEAVSDGIVSKVRILRDVPVLALALQAYGDYPHVRRQGQGGLGVLGITFSTDWPHARQRAGDDWNVVLHREDEVSLRGTVYALAQSYPDRLRLAARGMAAACGVTLDESRAIIAERYVPGGFGHVRQLWGRAMQCPDRLSAARFVLDSYES